MAGVPTFAEFRHAAELHLKPTMNGLKGFGLLLAPTVTLGLFLNVWLPCWIVLGGPLCLRADANQTCSGGVDLTMIVRPGSLERIIV
jgi:hypothetical protein